MKGKHSIFLLLILVALMSCNDPKPVTDTLHRAEALMNEYPDSAWTLLNTISSDDMEQKRNRALYALLYTQAQDKTYRDETNDSLISVYADGMIQLSLLGEVGEFTLTVTNQMTGERWSAENALTLQTSTASGIYWVQIETEYGIMYYGTYTL